MTAYEVLGVEPDTSLEKVGNVYQQLYTLYHANNEDGHFNEQIELLNKSYDMIKNGYGHYDAKKIETIEEIKTDDRRYYYILKLGKHILTMITALIGCCLYLHIMGDNFHSILEYDFDNLWFMLVCDITFVGLVKLVIFSINIQSDYQKSLPSYMRYTEYIYYDDGTVDIREPGDRIAIGIIAGVIFLFLLGFDFMTPQLLKNEDFWSQVIFVAILFWIIYTIGGIFYYTFRVIKTK